MSNKYFCENCRNDMDQMDVKEKLVELLDDMQRSGTGYLKKKKENKKITDYLIAHGVTVQEWISIKDRLPEEVVNCIVHQRR